MAPVWKGQPWYPMLLGMLYDYPQQLPRTLSVVQLTSSASQIIDNLWPNGLSALTSRVAYLQQKFGGGGLSEAAKELRLSSWRSKTSKASSRNGWVGVLNGASIPPISTVANFLADLHAQGYQFS